MEQESKPEQYRMVFLEYGMKRHFETNCFLKEKGTAATELWYIAKGTVRAFCTSVDGDDITLFQRRKYYLHGVLGSKCCDC